MEDRMLGFALLNPTYRLLLDLAIQQERFWDQGIGVEGGEVVPSGQRA